MNVKSRLILLMLACLYLSACNQAVGREYSRVKPTNTLYSSTVTDIAIQQIGKPYKYGGNGPSNYDCSGLVHYAYTKAGITIPRNSTAQLQYATRIPVNSLESGDLVFFSISQNKISHVGIYLGNNRFIHSPSSGKRVQIVTMDNPYWQSRFITAARVER